MNAPSKPSPSGDALILRNLSKTYGHLRVLHDISLKAGRGDVVSIIGSSGSGKSTLLRCLNMLDLPDRGEVLVSGEAVRFRHDDSGHIRGVDRRQAQRIRSRIGTVFQDFNLWSHRTVLENVIEAPLHVLKRPRAECVAQAEQLLAQVGIYEKRSHYPAHLSGGQQQRAAIARALAVRPELLLFDEPTSALDPELVDGVLQLIRKLAEDGHTMLVVTHELSFARDVSSRIVFLNKGSIEEEGTPSDLFLNARSPRLHRFLNGKTSKNIPIAQGSQL